MLSNSLMESVATQFSTSKSSAVVVTTDVTPSPLVEKFAELTLQELERNASTALLRELDQLAEDSILKYYKTLIYLRVLNVNGGLHGKMSVYRSVYRTLMVPTFLYQMLVSIGVSRDEDYNIIFKPAYSIDANDLLALEELVNISELLIRFEYLAQVPGLPKDETGELAFMAMHHVNGVVTSYRKDHPVYGFLASFFAQQEFNEVTGMMHRITYGNTSDYELMMATLLRKYLMGGD